MTAHVVEVKVSYSIDTGWSSLSDESPSTPSYALYPLCCFFNLYRYFGIPPLLCISYALYSLPLFVASITLIYRSDQCRQRRQRQRQSERQGLQCYFECFLPVDIRRSIYKIIAYRQEKKKMLWLLTLCLRSCHFARLWRNRLSPSGAASGGYLTSLSLVKLTTLTAFSSLCLLVHAII